jgi:hypothetical protein
MFNLIIFGNHPGVDTLKYLATGEDPRARSNSCLPSQVPIPRLWVDERGLDETRQCDAWASLDAYVFSDSVSGVPVTLIGLYSSPATPDLRLSTPE